MSQINQLSIHIFQTILIDLVKPVYILFWTFPPEFR